MTNSKREPHKQARRQLAPRRPDGHPFGIRNWSFALPRTSVIYPLFLLLAIGTSFGQDQFIDKVGQLEVEGSFKGATKLLNDRLGLPGLGDQERKRLEFERDRLDRIKKDFPYTTEALFAELQH